ncbi:AAA family ATPase [Brevibacillus migulae]|uniref:AAA family ATPase n=1 Tax=Brevibacillus migulae TaxID=1644114 RepID=UPI00106EC203|nr:AAA family ATPase [Brevibacillus migulae]
MNADKTGVFLITGIMASGKSTIAELLARKFERAIHLRGDAFRRMIVSGREEMLPDSEGEAIRQLRLRHQISARVADTYFAAGFNVVLQDVIIGPMLQETVDFIQQGPLYVVVLIPAQEEVAKREANRSKTGYGLWTIAELDRRLREQTPRVGLWLDTSHQSPEESVEEIWDRVWTEGRVR